MALLAELPVIQVLALAVLLALLAFLPLGNSP